VNLAQVPKGHPAYQADEDEPEALLANFNRILRTIGNYPGVETVAVAAKMSSPDGISYQGMHFYPLTDTTNIIGCQIIYISPAEDFFHVFGYTQEEGSNPVSVQDFNWDVSNAVVISHSIEQVFFPDGNAIGQTLRGGYPGGGDTQEYRVVGVVDNTKRFNYERPQNTVYLPMRITATNLWQSVISIRSKASISDAVFQEAFAKEMESALRTGNFFLESVVSYKLIKADTDRTFGVTNQLRTRLYLMIFFLLNILLCVMGTFWYRVNLRRGEIGLRKAMGSSGRNIRKLFFIEGFCLLAVAALAAMVVELQFVKAGIIDEWNRHGNFSNNSQIIYFVDRTVIRFLITNALTTGILAVVILSAIWLPARRAGSVPPVDALRDE
jgi:ABC-type antimicrobial peptide transport system permease subunit